MWFILYFPQEKGYIPTDEITNGEGDISGSNQPGSSSSGATQNESATDGVNNHTPEQATDPADIQSGQKEKTE